MKLFLQKNVKFSSAGGSAPRPLCLRRLGASPPNPQPPAAGGFTPRPPWPLAARGFAPKPPASGSWGLHPQTPIGHRRLGALLPNPQPLASGGFTPRPPLASSGWGLWPQTPKTAPPLRIPGYVPDLLPSGIVG